MNLFTTVQIKTAFKDATVTRDGSRITVNTDSEPACKMIADIVRTFGIEMQTTFPTPKFPDTPRTATFDLTNLTKNLGRLSPKRIAALEITSYFDERCPSPDKGRV